MHGDDAGPAERLGLGQHPKPYRLVLRGELGERFAAGFEGMVLESRDGKTFLEGALDQAQLHGILERAQYYNLEIIEVAEVLEDSRAEVTGDRTESNE